MVKNRKVVGLIIAGVLVLSMFTNGHTDSQVTPGMCPNALPNFFSDICWKCFFPLRVGGKIVMKWGNLEDITDFNVNPDDFNPSTPFCVCEVQNKHYYGVYLSFWDPVRVVEVMSRPGCFASLGGIDSKDMLNIWGALGGRTDRTAEGNKAFYNVHIYDFPLFKIMQIMGLTHFCDDTMLGVIPDINLVSFTEVDPLWNDEMLLNLSYPESSIFANEAAQALCAIDCMTTTAQLPMNALFWCAGCWGSLYPMVGNSGISESPVTTTSLLMARMLGRMTRIPSPPFEMEWDTSSSAAKCGPTFRPMLKKSQYKISTLFPISEASGRCCHKIGESTFTWGEFRNIPGIGEWQSYLVWRKRNCCLVIF